MKRKFFLHSILILSFFCCNAQQKFEIGIEGGLSNYYYSIEEQQNNLKSTPNISGFGGINFRVNSKKKYFGEIAVILTEYTDGVKLKQQLGYVTSNHDEVLLIPIRLGRPFFISKTLSFVPGIGVAPAFKTLSQDGSGTIYSESNGNSNSMYHYTFRNNGKDFFLLINANAIVEWTIKNKMKALAGVNYYKGFTEISVADITYQINNEPSQAGLLIGKGTFIGYSIGLKYIIK